eukprot:15275005-Alexandrium_andersonii.AAC.1
MGRPTHPAPCRRAVSRGRQRRCLAMPGAGAAGIANDTAGPSARHRQQHSGRWVRAAVGRAVALPRAPLPINRQTRVA